MGDPRRPKGTEDLKSLISGAQMEVISTISALNMCPKKLENPIKDAMYLSELDVWAAHAREHSKAAFVWLDVLQSKLKT